MRIDRFLCGAAAMTMAGLGIVAAPPAAQAATPVPCSEAALRTAISTANSHGGAILELSPGCTYTLTAADTGDTDNGLPVITSPITINGHRDTITRSAAAPNFRIFEITPPTGNLTLNDLTVSGGRSAAGQGGGILLDGGGTLTLNRTTVTHNTAVNQNGNGGGMDNQGTATLNNSVVTGNTATDVGGGIQNSGTLVLNQTFVTGNTAVGQGGGIFTNGGSVTLTRSVVSGNHLTGASPQGCAIFNNGRSTLTLVQSTVLDNRPRTRTTPAKVRRPARHRRRPGTAPAGPGRQDALWDPGR